MGVSPYKKKCWGLSLSALPPQREGTIYNRREPLPETVLATSILHAPSQACEDEYVVFKPARLVFATVVHADILISPICVTIHLGRLSNLTMYI